MPPITGAGAAPSPLTLVTSSNSIQPSAKVQGRGFKAIQGLAKRIRKWQGGAHAASRGPFVLLRAEHESRVNKAARCRERIAQAGRCLHANAGHAPDGDVLATLQRAEAKLQEQTRVHATLRDVLIDGTVRAYLPETGARQARQRYKGLIKLRQGPLNAPHPAGSAPQAVRAALDCATVLEASARQVKALGQAYAADDGRIALSAPLVHDLVSLLNGMKMLRRQDQDAADFLYPAVKLMHEANRGAGPGADAAVANLLRDLGAAGRDDPLGLRAQLVRQRDGLDFWLAHNASESYGRAPAAARKGLANELDALLDGLAGAARKVLHDELLSHVPGWARQAQPGLFREAGILHASAQRWRDRDLARGTREAVLQAPPAEAVRMLLEQAANEALETPAAPAGNLAPLIGNFKAQLGQVAAGIEQALDEHRVGHAAPGEVVALRQALMQAVLEETGILGEIHRVGVAGNAAAAATVSRAGAAGAAASGTSAAATAQGSIAATAPVPARRAARRDPRNPQTASARFGAVSRPLHPKVVKRMKHAAADAQRQVIKILHACRQPGDKPLSAHKLKALNEAYAALAAVHGESASKEWQGLLEAETMRLKERDVRALIQGTLRNHGRGDGHLTSRIANEDMRAESDRLLDDIWTAVRTSSVKRNALPFLKTWCASLSAPADMADGTALHLQVEGLRDRIGILPDDKVTVRTLLHAALSGLSNSELKALIGALATAPAAGTPPSPLPSLPDVSSMPALPHVSAVTPPRTPDATLAPAPAAQASDLDAAGSQGRHSIPADAHATPPIDSGTLTLRKWLMRYLRGNEPRPSADVGAPPPPRIKTEVFLDHLYAAAREQAEKRMEALRDSLIPPFRATLFAQAAAWLPMVDTPQARAVNGPPGETLESVIRDAARQGRLIHQYGADTAVALVGTRFLRTAQGYDVVRDMTRALSKEMASLHARLEAGMEEVGIVHFRSRAGVAAWRDSAVNEVLKGTDIWARLDAAARRLPSDTATQPDAPVLSKMEDIATLRRGGTRQSARSTRSVDRDGYARSQAFPGKNGTAAASDGNGYATIDDAFDERLYAAMEDPSDEPIYATIGVPADAPIYTFDRRASTVVSDDSGIEQDTASQISLDGHLYEALRGSASGANSAPSSPSSRTGLADTVPDAPPAWTVPHARMAASKPGARAAAITPDAAATGTVDPRLAAALRAALEQRDRGAWNRA